MQSAQPRWALLRCHIVAWRCKWLSRLSSLRSQELSFSSNTTTKPGCAMSVSAVLSAVCAYSAGTGTVRSHDSYPERVWCGCAWSQIPLRPQLKTPHLSKPPRTSRISWCCAYQCTNHVQTNTYMETHIATHVQPAALLHAGLTLANMAHGRTPEA
jgi:hypothetical protein